MSSWVHRTKSNLCQRCAEGVPQFEKPEFLCFHGTAQEVRQQARDGCHFCRQLVIALHLYKTVPTRGGAWDFSPAWDRDERAIQTEAEFAGSHINSAPVKGRPNEGKPLINLTSWQQTRGGIPFPRLQRFAEFQLTTLDDDLRYFRSVLPLDSFPGTCGQNDGYYKPAAIARACLESCVQNHGCRSGLEDGPLPTRVIDVGKAGQGDPRLYTPSDESAREKYVALSYCWGLANKFVLTSANLQQFQQGFSVDYLPRTLRDAVELTRDLGLRYLWIDALCILQGTDDKACKDWVVEFPRMGEYYGNAYFTIAAAGAQDADGGLFAPQIENGRILPSAGGGHFALTPYEPRPSLADQPINSRGWTLQERLLSPRILVCSFLGIAWQCGEALMGSVVDSSMTGGPEVAEQYRLPPAPARPDWMKIVEDYTARRLSNPTDKFPAIASLAARYQTVTVQGDHYLAGLWESDLMKHLLWKPVSGVKITRPASYPAPSWSWAALDGPLHYANRENDSTEWIAQMRACQVVHTNPANPFGPVSGAELTIYGPLLQVSCHWVKSDWSYLYPLGHAPNRDHTLNDDGERALGFVNHDVVGSPDSLLLQLKDEKTLFCLVIALGVDYGVLGLLPVRNGNTNALLRFTRFGIVSIKKPSFFKDAPAETVTII
ncbi:HET-domain-containing protein [Thozetella sp. PMI_491]|nr:HET-domain-containing protein [Thozetella sp. PMI_491]